MKEVFIGICLWCATLTVSAQKAVKAADSIRRADSIPELAYAVLTADAGKALKGFGFHRSTLKNDDTKALPTDYFHLGSNTKAITAFIAGYLVERQKISWDTKFFTLFPEWKAGADPAYFNITLSDLLSHRARIKPYTAGTEFQQVPKTTGSKSEQRKNFAKYLLHSDPVKLTTAAYTYSNAGYSVAALMLEQASGKTWEDLVEEVLGKELKLKYKFGWPNKGDDKQPSGHWMQDGKLTPVPGDTDYNLNLIEPAGDLSMPLGDYAKFIQLHLAGLKGKDNLLKAATYQYLHYGIEQYAMGWLNINKSNKHSSEHAGSAGTFYCYTLINKDKDIAYIIVANTATEKALKGIFSLLNILIKEYE